MPVARRLSRLAKPDTSWVDLIVRATVSDALRPCNPGREPASGRAVFGATGEVQDGRPTEIRIGDSVVMVSAAGQRELFPAFLYVYVEDADGAYHRVLAASVEEPFDTPYGDRRAMARDPWGNVFQVAPRQRRAGSPPAWFTPCLLTGQPPVSGYAYAIHTTAGNEEG